jgi:hypothetical protein
MGTAYYQTRKKDITMLTELEAKLLLSYVKPHTLHPELFKQPITPNHVRIPVSTAQGLGIMQESLNDDPAYDHQPEYVEGNGMCHVFYKDKLEQRAGIEVKNRGR